jgi:nucleoside-diphosphate-sugar epimerase
LAGDAKLRGTGRETRDYLHVRDVANALELIARKSPFEGEVINIASGEELAMSRVAALIHAASGTGLNAAFDGTELAGSPLRWRADVQRIGALGFKPEVAVEAGIPETVEWIKRHA